MSSQDLAAASPRTGLTYGRVTFRGGAFLVAAAALVAVVVTHLVNFGTDDLRIRLLNANLDASWSHLVTAGLLLAATALAAAGAWRSHDQRVLWFALTAILGFLAVDEISSLHAVIDRMSWGKLVYAPILIAFCLCMWRVNERSGRSAVVVAGLVTLLVSFAIHVFGPHLVHALGWGNDSWAYQVKVALKQGTELAGWLLVLFGLGKLVASSTRPSGSRA